MCLLSASIHFFFCFVLFSEVATSFHRRGEKRGGGGKETAHQSGRKRDLEKTECYTHTHTHPYSELFFFPFHFNIVVVSVHRALYIRHISDIYVLFLFSVTYTHTYTQTNCLFLFCYLRFLLFSSIASSLLSFSVLFFLVYFCCVVLLQLVFLLWFYVVFLWCSSVFVLLAVCVLICRKHFFFFKTQILVSSFHFIFPLPLLSFAFPCSLPAAGQRERSNNGEERERVRDCCVGR